MKQIRPAPYGSVRSIASAVALLLPVVGCGAPSRGVTERETGASTREDTLVVHETTIATVVDAFGTAAPIRHAVLSTTLMGSVRAVVPVAGSAVSAGTVLVRIDARQVAAGSAQAAGVVAAAQAVASEAETQASRIRALYADSAAPRAQLDASEAALARARAGLTSAQAALDAAAASASYAEIRAPFDGIVTARYVDPGTLVAPGTPVLVVDDESRLRVSAAITPQLAVGLRPGGWLDARIEGRPATARVEGLVPVPGTAMYDVDAVIDNRDHSFLAGGAATLRIPAGTHQGIRIPSVAVVREGDLTGVRVRSAAGEMVRWVRVAPISSDESEVLSGLAGGDVVVVRRPPVSDP